MDDFEDFGVVFSGDFDLAYDQSAVDKIAKNRRLLENTLFFDRLLGAVGINKTAHLYPPKSNADFRHLYDAIIGASAQDHHKHSLIYYILKDLRLKNRNPETFAQTTYLPERYRIFIDGIWHLDRLALNEALEYLAEPCLIPTFPDEILYVLSRHCQADHTIPLQYYNTVSPPLASVRVLDAYFQCLCKASITEAFFFARSSSLPEHRHLFERMLSFVLSHSSGEARADRAMELIRLPLDAEEESWFENYLLGGKGQGLYGAKDTVIMRQMALGNEQRAQELSRDVKERKRVDNMNWASLTQSFGAV